MKKTIGCRIIGGLVLMFGLSNFVFGQITVTSSDAPGVPGTYFEMSGADTVTVDLGQGGGNQYWDFSNYDFNYISYWRVLDPNKAPFMSSFPNANVVYEVTYDVDDTITFNYVRLTESDLTELGQAKVVVSDTDTSVVSVAAPKRVTPRLNLPATFGDPPWSSVITIDTTYLGFAVTIIDSSYNQIDAWGTMKTQFGEFSCLRVRQNHLQFAQSAFINLPLEININYYWITNTYGILATVTGMSDVTNPNPDPDFTTAESIDIMTNYLTSVKNFAKGEVPDEFRLFQNYPNPFNPKTTIGYQLNEVSEVTLRVFNINGQEVALLVRDRQQPGRYEFEWNASHLPSGIYYYQIKTNQNVLTQKCLLLK